MRDWNKRFIRKDEESQGSYQEVSEGRKSLLDM